MRPSLLPTLLALLLAGTSAHALEGTRLDIQLHSEAVREARSAGLYLPPGYDPVGDTLYPAVLFLHGGDATPADYAFVFNVVDQAIVDGAIEPVVLLLPDGTGGSWLDMTWWVDSPLNGGFGSLLHAELMPWLGRACRARGDEAGRGVIGHSMGGFGAARLALVHPDRLAGAVSLSGVTDLTSFLLAKRDVIVSENGGSGPYDPAAGYWTQIMFSMAEALSPEPGAEPWPLEVPLDDSGALVDSVMTRWRAHNPPDLAAPGMELNLLFDAGSAEPDFGLCNDVFAESLAAAGIPHRQTSYTGGHDDQLEERVRAGLVFLDSLFALPRPGLESVSLELDTAAGTAHATAALAHPEAGTELWMDLTAAESGDTLSARLLDDGEHGDGAAGDLTYGGSWTLPATPDRYAATLRLGTAEDGWEIISSPAGTATSGPVTISDLILAAPLQPGGMATLTPLLSQQSPELELDSLRAWVTIGQEAPATFLNGSRLSHLDLPDLPPGSGETAGPSFFLVIAADAAEGDLIPLEVAIAEDDVVYWRQHIVLEVGSAHGVAGEAPVRPGGFAIRAVYPNPGNSIPTATIRVPGAGEVQMALYNLAGRRIQSWSEPAAGPGTLRIPVDTDGLASGTYLLSARSRWGTATRRLTLLR